jgi:hypothetical protein
VRKQSILLVAVFVCLVLLTVPYVSAAGSAVKPTLTLPSSDWTLKTDTAYPNSHAEHDPQGAGLLEYQNTVNYDFVMVYYEQAVDAQPSQSSLQADAEHIFAKDHTDTTMSSSGIMTIAGVQAGYAKGYDSSVGTYGVVILETSFVKGNDYFNVFAYYDDNSQSETQVTSLMNSINLVGATTQGTQSLLLYIVIAVVAIIVVVVVLLVVLRKRKSKLLPAAQPVYTTQPPPPPPPSM